ncbi:Gfo/Idh/MocA family oxidoreductase [Haloechinothrix salitolerans]|uniref:Gfo/Idh/MocA family oxidoreductase n=1 Tax=Haloechinothrix salitolerans TaxID=926830 RepID=A0ABW2C7S9_9PSEU
MSSDRTRIALVGLDSSRPTRLLEFLTGPTAPDRSRVRYVVGLEGDDPEPLAERFAVEATGMKVSDIIGSVDAALLCTRDGRAHADQALPLLEAGISVWVDKPLATCEDDARSLVRAAATRGLVLACRSGLRDADAVSAAGQSLRRTAGTAAFTIAGPADPGSPHGGLAHYGIHHVELCCEVTRRAGRGAPRAVTGIAVDDGRVRATVQGDRLTAELVFDAPGRCQGFAIMTDGGSWPVEAPPRYLEQQVLRFVSDVQQDRGTPDPEALVTPVRLLEQLLEHQ